MKVTSTQFTMKFAFMQNPLSQIQFFAQIISHLLEWSKVLQKKNGIRVHFDQCVLAAWTRYFQQQRNAKLEFKMHRQTCLLIFLYKAYSFCQHA